MLFPNFITVPKSSHCVCFMLRIKVTDSSKVKTNLDFPLLFEMSASWNKLLIHSWGLMYPKKYHQNLISKTETSQAQFLIEESS